MELKPWHRHYDYNVPTTVRLPRIAVHELIEISSKAYPDKPALNFNGTEMTFWELRLLVMRFANALGTLGVQKGERVGIHLPNCPQYPISYYAVLSLGAIVVNLNPMYTVDELKMIVNVTGLKTVITFDTALSSIRALYKEFHIPRVVVTKVTDYMKGVVQSTAASLELEAGWYHFSGILESCTETKRPRVQVNPEDPAMIQFTGGTTGIPKGAVLTHANVIAATFQCAFWENPIMNEIPTGRRIFVAALPYFHVYGNIVVMNHALFRCATQIVIPRFQIDEFMELLANFKEITFFPSVPTMISAVINHPKATELDLARKLGSLQSGGASIPVELIEQVKDMGIFLNEGYGLTESTSLGSCNPKLGLKKVGSIGIPSPDVDIRLVDLKEGIRDVARGTPGEIIMKGPNVMQGYWNNPQETAGQLKDGWLYTGDIGVRDEDDYFFLVDRKKDLIIAGGYNIYPREIDEVLYRYPKVQEAVTVGIADKYRGETVKAYIVLKPGDTATAEEIIAFCREKLAAYKVPRLVEFRTSLPKSAVGKVLRKILRAEEEAHKKE